MNRNKSRLNKTIKYRTFLVASTNKDIVFLYQKTTELYRRCVSFCLMVLKDNLEILETTDSLRYQQQAVERLIHRTKNNEPIYDLSQVEENIPAYFSRAFINTALGIAQSWYSNYNRWVKNGRKGRPPVLRTENRQWPVYYKGMYKEFTKETVMLKLYTGKSWAWRKVRISTTQKIQEDAKEQSVKIVIKGGHGYLHRTYELNKKKVKAVRDKVLAVDLNIDRAVVMVVIGRDGRVYSSKFINTREDNRRRKFYLEAITERQAKTRIIPEGCTFCKRLWEKVHNFNENLSDTLSRRIVDFAKEHGCTTIVFEHLEKLRPDKRNRASYFNSKLMYWLKGSIYRKTYYKAKWEGLWTTRVNPRWTSTFCNLHHDIYNYRESGGTSRPVQNRFVCSICNCSVDADFNACINIARRFFSRHSEIKALNGDIEAWQGAIRFLSGRMNPLYSGLGDHRFGTDGATLHVSAPYPYPRQVKVPGINQESSRL